MERDSINWRTRIRFAPETGSMPASIAPLTATAVSIGYSYRCRYTCNGVYHQAIDKPAVREEEGMRRREGTADGDGTTG